MICTTLTNLCCRYLRDTPRWLIKKGQDKKASRAVIYIKKWDEKVSAEKAKQIKYIIEKSVKKEVSFFVLFIIDKSIGSILDKRIFARKH